MTIDEWLSLPDSLKWSRPNPDDYDDEEALMGDALRWKREVQDYEDACDRAVDEQRDRRAEEDSYGRA